MLYPSNSQTTSFLSLPFFPVMWHMSDTVVTCLEVCQPPSQPSTKAFHRYITPWCHMAWCHMVPHGVTWCHMVKRLTAPLHLTPLLLLLCTKKNTHTHARVCVLYIIYNCKIIVYTHTYIYHNVRVVVGLVGMECDTPSSPIVCQFSRDSWFL